MNIPEGAELSQIPRFGYGRILVVAPWPKEHYATLTLFGWAIFAAFGRMPTRWYFRWWCCKR